MKNITLYANTTNSPECSLQCKKDQTFIKQICQCLPKDKLCKRCSNLVQCFRVSTDMFSNVYYCVKQRCQPRGYPPICHDVNVGEPCFTETQCKHKDTNTGCDETTKMCACLPGTVYADKRCYKKAHLGDLCHEDKECSVAVTDSNCKEESETGRKHCVCKSGFLVSGDSCIAHKETSSEHILLLAFVLTSIVVVLFVFALLYHF